MRFGKFRVTPLARQDPSRGQRHQAGRRWHTFFRTLQHPGISDHPGIRDAASPSKGIQGAPLIDAPAFITSTFQTVTHTHCDSPTTRATTADRCILFSSNMVVSLGFPLPPLGFPYSNKRIFSGREDTTVFLVRRRTVCHVMSSWHVIMSSWWSDSIQPCDSLFRGCVLLILSAAAIWSLNHQQRGWRSLNTRTDIRWDTTRSADTKTWNEPNYPCE